MNISTRADRRGYFPVPPLPAFRRFGEAEKRALRILFRPISRAQVGRLRSPRPLGARL